MAVEHCLACGTQRRRFTTLRLEVLTLKLQRRYVFAHQNVATLRFQRYQLARVCLWMHRTLQQQELVT